MNCALLAIVDITSYVIITLLLLLKPENNTCKRRECSLPITIHHAALVSIIHRVLQYYS